MKKVYLLASVLLSGLTLNAQKLESMVNLPASKKTTSVASKAIRTNHEKAEGQTLWSNNFTTTSDWAATSGTNHVGPIGKWEILNAVPTSLVTQSNNGYGFPIAMNSTSGGNFAFINSDDAGSTGYQDDYFTYTGTIDLSSTLTGTGLYLEFDNIFRHYYEEFWIEVSNDNGANWIPFQVNTDNATNTNSLDPEHEVVNITSADLAGASQCKVRLHYIGNYDWFWGVDDIKITEAWQNDALMVNTFMRTDTTTTIGADYYSIPSNQVDFPGQLFRSLAKNNGTATQTEFKTRATCAAASYNALSGLGWANGNSIAMGISDTFEITTPFNPTTPGVYDVIVSTDLGSVTDSYTDNDTTSFRGITIGGDIYARDNGAFSGGLTRFADDTKPVTSWFNYMDVFNDYTVGSIKTYIPSSQPSAFPGDLVWNSIDQWDADNQSWNEIMQTEQVDISSANFGAWLTLDSDAGEILMIPGSYRIHFHRTDLGDNTLRLGMAQACPNGTMGGILASDGTSNGLVDPNALMIRLSSAYSGSINELSNKMNVNIYPNPVNSVANVSFNMKNASNVELNVTDLSGKVVYTNNLENMNSGNQTIAINTESLTNGIYMVNIVSNGAKTTQKFVVKK